MKINSDINEHDGGGLRNPFDRLTNWSIDRPKTAVVTLVTMILALSMFVAGPIPESLGVGIEFDNSEDAFFPDRRTNEDVNLLYDIEETYSSSIDILRVMVSVEKGDLQDSQTWAQLAVVEAEIIEHEASKRHRLDVGTGAVIGPASTAWSWEQMVDPIDVPWLDEIEVAYSAVFSADTTNLSKALDDALKITQDAPMEVSTATASELRNWTPPQGMLERLDAGENRSNRIEAAMGQTIFMGGIEVDGVYASDDPELSAKISVLQAAMGAVFGFHNAIQDVPYLDLILSTLPSKEIVDGTPRLIAENERWNQTDLVTLSMFIDTEPASWVEAAGWENSALNEDNELSTSNAIRKEVENWTLEMESVATLAFGNGEVVSTVSFSHFENAQTEKIGAELGKLLGMSILLLTAILLTQFRTGRDVVMVITTTILGILGTYGLSGIANFTFNAAMNSIPILLIAIGVDYGIHVVARYREVLREEEEKDPQGRETLRDFPKEIRLIAIRKGAILTSGALLIAIFTDMVGFLSFRFASQKFLVDFGTVIAIGLFMIYVLSITLLPAMLTLVPPAKLKVNKAAAIRPGRIAKGFGRLTRRPFTVLISAVIVSIPVGAAMTTLEVGFDTRDQLNDSIPVVEDFLILVDRYDAAPSPIYVRFVPGESIFTATGWDNIDRIEQAVDSTKDAAEVTSIRSVLDAAATSDPVLSGLLIAVEDNPSNNSAWDNLESWVLTNETGRDLTARYTPSNGLQTVVQFSTATVDWADTVAFEERLTANLDLLSVDGEIGVAGRPLVLAQVTEGVATSAVVSTVLVAGVILVMLIGLQTVERGGFRRGAITGVFMWIPLGMVVVWVYGIMAAFGYELNAQTVTIGALTLGLGVDYAVHYAHRYEEEREADPDAHPEVWVARTSVTTGRAMAGAAITTAGGFAILNLSGLAPLRLFGQVFLVAISLALLSSLILLPVLLSLRPGERDGTLGVESE